MDVLSQNVKQKDEAVRVELKSLLRDYATDLYVDDGPADREEKTLTSTPAVISAPPTKAKDETKKEEPKVILIFAFFKKLTFLLSDRAR